MLQSLMVWDRWRANHDGQIDGDPDSPNRGKPIFHVLSADGAMGGQRVHWSRVLRFEGDIVDWWTWRANACWNDSVLQVMFEPLKQYDSTTSAISSLIPKSLRDLIFAKGAAKEAATSDGEARLARRYAATARIASMWNVSVYDLDNEKHEQRTFNFSGLDKIWEKAMKEVGGGAGYPNSILFDDQASGLGDKGDSSRDNYHSDLVAERKLMMEPQHLAIAECVTRNELGDLPDGFAIEYKPLAEPSALEESTINKNSAEADHVRIDDGVITAGLAAREAKERSLYKTMNQSDVDLAELAPPPSQEADALGGDPLETKEDKPPQAEDVPPVKAAKAAQELGS
jgi:phage-related protein (TIGR01555 family)